jgi:hypothetical protein
MYQTPDSRDRLTPDANELRTRALVDARGNEWLVREVDTPQPWARAKRYMIFSSSAVVRRLWEFPKDWARLSSGELLALLDEEPTA